MALNGRIAEIIRWVIWILLLVFLAVLGRMRLINNSPDLYVFLLFAASTVIVIVFRFLGPENQG